MNFSDIQLPSNKKFGFFFTIVFTLFSGYFYINSLFVWAYVSAAMAVLFFLAAILRPHFLLPFNKLWMSFGLILGTIISPIVLGIIFFGLITPLAFLMRFSGRDELHLKFKSKPSHWILRTEPIQADSFKHQF